MRQTDVEKLLQMLVAEGEVSRAALKVLTTWPDHSRFPELFKIEVDALLAKVDPSNPNDRRLGELMRAARDRLLGVASTSQTTH